MNTRVQILKHSIFVAFLSFGMWALFTLPVNAQEQIDNRVIAVPPFLLSDESLKPNIKGVNVDALISAVLKKKPLLKSEYETNTDFQERQRKSFGSQFLGQIRPGSRIAVIHSVASFPSLFSGHHSAVRSKYDAETETMTVKMDDWLSCLPLKRSTKPKRQYTATNGFGQKVNVLEVDEAQTCISLTDEGVIKSAELVFNFAMPKKSAAVEKRFLAAVVIGRLALPYANFENGHESATFKQPIEKNVVTRSLVMDVDDIWLINTATGTVLAKHKTPFANSAPALAENIESVGNCTFPRYGKSELPNSTTLVELEFVVSAEGSTEFGSVKRTSGISDLDNRALEAIAACKFKPGMKNGKPVGGMATVKFHFDSDRAWNY